MTKTSRRFAFAATFALVGIGVVLASGGCTSDTASTSGASDKCCPIAEPPLSCGGFAMGGSRAKNPSCPVPADNVPRPHRRSVDSDGCPFWDYTGEDTSVAYVCNAPKTDPCTGLQTKDASTPDGNCVDAASDATTD